MAEEMRAYEPGWKEQIAAWLAQNATGDTREGYKTASELTNAAHVASLPTPAGILGPVYDTTRGLSDAVQKWMASKSGPENRTKVDLPTAEQRTSEIDARMRELDGSKLANGLNKKLSSSRTSELNAQIDAEQKALAAEREKTLGDISNTKAVMKWEESPMRERYPNASLAATVASLPAAALLSRGIANKVTGGVEKAVGAANLARSERDPNKYVEAVQAAEGMATSAPYKTAAGATGAALLPPEIQAVPDLIDYKTMPKDSRAYQEAAGQFANPGAYVSGMAVPLIGGVAGSATGVAKSAAMGSTARAEAQAMGAGMSGTYADDVKSAGRQFNRQHKADQSRLANDQTQDLTAAATQAVVRSLDDPATMTPQLARKLIAQQMAQGAPAASGTGRGTLSAFNASQQAEFEKALREKIARNP